MLCVRAGRAPTRPAQEAIVPAEERSMLRTNGDEDDVSVAAPAAEATVCVMLASFAVNLTAGLSAANMLIKNGRRKGEDKMMKSSYADEV